MSCKHKQNYKKSLDDFLDEQRAYMGKTLLDKDLTSEDIAKIKDTLFRHFGKFTTDQKQIFAMFTGDKKIIDLKRDDIDGLGNYIEHIGLDKGNENYGAIHIVKRHFGENGDRNGGKIDWFDLMVMGEVVKKGTATIDQKTNRHIYTYEHNDKKYRLIVEKNGKKHKIYTFFTDDTYESGGLNASDNFQHSNGLGRGTNPEGDTPLISSEGILPKDDIKINSFIVPK